LTFGKRGIKIECKRFIEAKQLELKMRMTKKNKISIIDVANHANVSIATVSRVLNKATNILPETQRKVSRAVQALNYTPNAQAQNMRGKCRDIFGFLLSPEIVKIKDSHLILTIQHLLAETIFEEDFHLISEKLQMDDSGNLLLPRMLRQSRCCACFLLGYLPPSGVNTLIAEDIPVCLLGSYDGQKSDNLLSIDFDYQNGMYETIQYLSALRHRRIGFVHGNLEYPVNRKKMDGFLNSVKEFGLDNSEHLLIELNNSEQNFAGGRQATKALLALDSPPSAICYVNDWIALGGLCEAESQGLKVPDDLSLVGFDDSFIAEQSSPGLSSVRTDFDKMTKIAADIMIKKVRSSKMKKHNILVPTSLTRRESCQIFR
jgi:LacI family transcriptional regulator, galactose operon repressor